MQNNTPLKTKGVTIKTDLQLTNSYIMDDNKRITKAMSVIEKLNNKTCVIVTYAPYFTLFMCGNIDVHMWLKWYYKSGWEQTKICCTTA